MGHILPMLYAVRHLELNTVCLSDTDYDDMRFRWWKCYLVLTSFRFQPCIRRPHPQVVTLLSQQLLGGLPGFVNIRLT